MDPVLMMLKKKLGSLLHAETELTAEKAGALLTCANPYGGKPLLVFCRPGEDIKVTLNKTPRYYEHDETSLKRLLSDAASYADGRTVTLDLTDCSGTESKHDRIAKAADVENLTLDALIDLSIRINLANSVELEDLLAGGGTVNVHFWNPAKDFRYRQIGNDLEKI